MAVGGLVGQNNNQAGYSTFDGITYSYALIGGRVAGTWHIGGLVGWNMDLPLSFCYAHAAGGVASIAPDADNQYAIGGLVGKNADATVNGLISYCYALSDVSGDEYVGGLLGGSGSVTGSDSYFNSANTENGYGNAVSLANMKLQSIFAGQPMKMSKLFA